jgi:type II secretory pathway pseudopilin PulG
VSEAVLIDLHGNRWSGLAAKLREETGFGLIELLISLLVLNLGIFATMGAFTSGAVAIRNASRISTAAALADKDMEAFRDMSFNSPSFAVGVTTSTQTGADGRTYTVATTITSGSQLPSPAKYPGSSAVKVVSIVIRDPSNTAGGDPLGKVLYTGSSTFSQCAQDMTATACSTA